jgi:hypothetical protein
MNVFRTIDQDGRRPVVHVAGRHPVALCPSCSRPSVTTNGTGWRDVIDVVRTVVVTLSICVRRFVCEFDDCEKRTFDERFEGIGRGGASDRALAFFADLQRGRATRRVAIDLGRIITCASPSGKDAGLPFIAITAGSVATSPSTSAVLGRTSSTRRCSPIPRPGSSSTSPRAGTPRR